MTPCDLTATGATADSLCAAEVSSQFAINGLTLYDMTSLPIEVNGGALTEAPLNLTFLLDPATESEREELLCNIWR